MLKQAGLSIPCLKQTEAGAELEGDASACRHLDTFTDDFLLCDPGCDELFSKVLCGLL